MKLKLDENLDSRLCSVLREHRHDAVTVRMQDLAGASDQEVFEVARQEGRALVTLDLHFANVIRFPPEKAAGIIVLRGSHNLLSTTRLLVDNLIKALAREDPNGALWVVETTRLRIHVPDDEE